MRSYFLTMTLGLTVLGQLCLADDFPLEPIQLHDGVLLINKATGQNWILEIGPRRPPGAPYEWKQLPLPGANMPGAIMPGANTTGPGFPGPGFPGPGMPSAGMPGGMPQNFPHPPQMPNAPRPYGPAQQHPGPPQHPGNHQPGGHSNPTGQMMPGPNGMGMMPPVFWQAPHPGFIPLGSYSQAVPPGMLPSLQPIPTPQLPSEPQTKPDKADSPQPADVDQDDQDDEAMDKPEAKSSDEKPADKPKPKKRHGKKK